MRFGLCMRIPTWCSQGQFMPGGLYTYQDTTDEEIEVRVNGRTAEYRMENGFAVIDRKWKKGDVVELNLPMPVRRGRCDGRVEENVGTSAVTRGPLVYCAEEADNGTVQQLQLGKGQADVRTVSEGVLQGIPRIDLPGSRTGEDMAESDVTVRFIPYYAWCNRGDNQSMRIWIPNRGEHRAAERTEETTGSPRYRPVRRPKAPLRQPYATARRPGAQTRTISRNGFHGSKTARPGSRFRSTGRWSSPPYRYSGYAAGRWSCPNRGASPASRRVCGARWSSISRIRTRHSPTGSM